MSFTLQIHWDTYYVPGTVLDLREGAVSITDEFPTFTQLPFLVG